METGAEGAADGAGRRKEEETEAGPRGRQTEGGEASRRRRRQEVERGTVPSGQHSSSAWHPSSGPQGTLREWGGDWGPRQDVFSNCRHKKSSAGQ